MGNPYPKIGPATVARVRVGLRLQRDATRKESKPLEGEYEPDLELRGPVIHTLIRAGTNPCSQESPWKECELRRGRKNRPEDPWGVQGSPGPLTNR